MIKSNSGTGIRHITLSDGTLIHAVQVSKDNMARVVEMAKSDIHYLHRAKQWVIESDESRKFDLYFNEDDWLILGDNIRFKLPLITKITLYFLRGTNGRKAEREFQFPNSKLSQRLFTASMYEFSLNADTFFVSEKQNYDIRFYRHDNAYAFSVKNHENSSNDDTLWVPKDALPWVLAWSATYNGHTESYDGNSLCYIPEIVWRDMDDIALVLN